MVADSTEHSNVAEKRNRGKSTRPLWRNVSFLILYSGQAISNVGTQISLVTYPLLLLALTHSPAEAGLLTAIRTVPLVVFGLPAGALVDRWNWKYVMIVCDTLRAIVLGSIALVLVLFHQITFVQIAFVAFIDGTCSLFFSIAAFSAIPNIVEAEQLSDALSLNETVEATSTMLGPALGPVLYAVGSAWPFLVDSVSTLISVISLFFVRSAFQRQRIGHKTWLWQEIREGMVWLWRQKLLRFLALLTFGLITPCTGYLLVLIVQAQRLHATDTALGLILGGSGLGGIVGSLVAGRLYQRFGLANMIIWSSGIWALTWLFYAFAPNVLILGLVNAASFIIVPIYMVVQYSCRIALTPDHLQGRVNALFRLISVGGQPVGIAVTGILLQSIGPVWTVVILFVPQMMLVVAVLWMRTELRGYDMRKSQVEVSNE